jgi:hypothetical protein
LKDLGLDGRIVMSIKIKEALDYIQLAQDRG